MKSNVSAENVEAFILTFNRKNLLVQSLDSLLAQTVRGLQITVLDNGSTDGTPEALANYVKRGVRYLRTGEEGNFKRAQQLCQRDWVLLFHDDDILHPGYISSALKIINERLDWVMVASSMSFESAPQPNWVHPTAPPAYTTCNSPRDLAALMYWGYPLCFPSVLYRAEAFRHQEIETAIYGKVCDRPLLLNVAKHGATAVIHFPFVKYRQHSGQDSASGDSGPYASQLAALHQNYHRLLGSDITSRFGRSFVVNNYSLLRNEFKNLGPRDREKFPDFGSYWSFMSKIEATSQLSRMLGMRAAGWIRRLQYLIRVKLNLL